MEKIDWLRAVAKEKLRFKAKTSERNANGCILWTAGKMTNGYGQFLLFGKQMGAHRAAWILYRGEIPAGLHVLHKCDVPACVNPEHLFLGTPADNSRDMMAKGRSYKGPPKRFHHKFVLWWIVSRPKAKRALAEKAGTSYVHLSNLATTRHKVFGPELAGRVETALDGKITRGELCETCSKCKYWKEAQS